MEQPGLSGPVIFTDTPQSQAGSLLPVTGWSPSGLLLGVSSTSQSLPVFAHSGEIASQGCTGVLINIALPGFLTSRSVSFIPYTLTHLMSSREIIPSAMMPFLFSFSCVLPRTFSCVLPRTFSCVLPRTFSCVLPRTFSCVLPRTFSCVLPRTFSCVLPRTFRIFQSLVSKKCIEDREITY